MRWLLVLLVACAEAQPAGHHGGSHPGPPMYFPDALWSAYDLNGNKVRFEWGRPTIVVWFASWCRHCHAQISILDELRSKHPVRVLGLNYKGHEDYAGRGGPVELRRYLDEHASWLRVVPADDMLFTALGSPRQIPTMIVFDPNGEVVTELRGSSLADLEAVLKRM